MTNILIVGGGYAGFYTAWQLEKQLNPGEAQVTLVDPLPYLTYQPFLPEVLGGHIEPRHVLVSHRRHLKRTRVVTAEVTEIDHAGKTATIKPADDEAYQLDYDIIVVTAGAVSRTFPIPGIAEHAIGLKTVEEAVWIRDTIIDNFNRASALPPGAQRERLLTFIVVGGGFAGIEAFAEARALATSLLEDYPSLQFDDVRFHLIEAAGRILPEVTEEGALAVIKGLAERGATVHLNTQVTDATDGVVVTSNGDRFPSDVIIWTAGVQAAPFVKSNSDLPVDERGRIRARADLRVEGEDGVVKDAWTAGDVAAVPDLSGGGVGGFTVPNAQHAVRQAKTLASNLVATLRGGAPHDYYHENLGAVAGLGPWFGSFRSKDFQLGGPIAWLAHRGYHGLAVPTLERKVRVFADWLTEGLLGRDFVSIAAREQPKAFFQRFAAKPRPKAPAAEDAPVAAAPAAAAEPSSVAAAKPASAKPSASGAKPAAPAAAAKKTEPAAAAGGAAEAAAAATK